MAPYMGLCLLKAVDLHQGTVTPLMGANQFPGMLLQLQVTRAAHVSGRRSMAGMQRGLQCGTRARVHGTQHKRTPGHTAAAATQADSMWARGLSTAKGSCTCSKAPEQVPNAAC